MPLYLLMNSAIILHASQLNTVTILKNSQTNSVL